MVLRSQRLIAAMTLGLFGLGAGTAQSAMSLEFAITPMVQPQSGSLDRDAGGRIVATNLAVTSVSAVGSAQVVPLSKYLDLQTAGSTGSNFFILDGLVQQYGGTAPTSMTAPATSSSLISTGAGYLFTMQITNGYVSNDLASKFGVSGGTGWTGVLTLDIAAFNPALGSSQVTSGMLTLTSPGVTATPVLASSAATTISAPTSTSTSTSIPTQVMPPILRAMTDPVPAGESITAAAVPEPSSIVLAGVGLLIAAGRFGSTACRSKR